MSRISKFIINQKDDSNGKPALDPIEIELPHMDFLGCSDKEELAQTLYWIGLVFFKAECVVHNFNEETQCWEILG